MSKKEPLVGQGVNTKSTEVTKSTKRTFSALFVHSVLSVFHRLRVLAVAAPVSALALTSGCHTCNDHERSDILFELAEMNYKAGKFGEAKVVYGQSLDKCEENEEAMLGLANASREVGNDEYRTAATMANENKMDEARRVFKDASENHALSFAILEKMLKQKPDDMAARYAMGLLYYQRATSFLPFPFPLDDSINRRRERDHAIDHFKAVVAKVPQAYQAHRYLGLALLAAGKTDEGRPHLRIYHDAQQALYERVVGWPGSTDDEKKRKETAMREVEREISAIREVIGEMFIALGRDQDKLAAKKNRTPEEEQALARLSRERLEIQNFLATWRLIKFGPIEITLRQRCQEYLDVFNRGSVPDIMSYVAARPGEEASVQKTVQDKVALGTQYRRPKYRTIVVSGDNASVALTCDVVNQKAQRADAELTLRWKLVGGQWKVAEIP